MAQNTDSLQYRPYPHLQPNEDSEDFKASYDTLIDGNGLPYSASSRHQTFTIASPTTSSLQRGISLPQTSKMFSSKQSDDTHETSCTYPPVVSPAEVDAPNLWQRVDTMFLQSCLCFSFPLLDFTRVYGLPFLCCDSPYRDRDRSCHRGRAIHEVTTNHAN